MTNKETYSTGEVAEILGVHIDTVRRFCNNGELSLKKGFFQLIGESGHHLSKSSCLIGVLQKILLRNAG